MATDETADPRVLERAALWLLTQSSAASLIGSLIDEAHAVVGHNAEATARLVRLRLAHDPALLNVLLECVCRELPQVVEEILRTEGYERGPGSDTWRKP